MRQRKNTGFAGAVAFVWLSDSSGFIYGEVVCAKGLFPKTVMEIYLD